MLLMHDAVSNETVGRDIIGFGTHRGTNQQWTLEDAGEGFFRIKNGSGKYLSVEGHVQNGARVIGSDHQQTWKILPDDQHPNEQGYIRYRSSFPVSFTRCSSPPASQNFRAWTHFNLDLEDFGNPAPGTRVQLWEKTPGKNQAWFFQSPQQ
ncbi:carbohydrate-binding module family 13 protein [Hydnum rufescens UP504]|uniref:Carbohydrate-binding module family 13 protein n=1 Tax=Hydnum rufescens UP504 TaxID=1448309 RepID=A0A9P6AT97_9AGAM|nr:carbohydrate-binding module family 13 protein [Hydnum rufescens UP504]